LFQQLALWGNTPTTGIPSIDYFVSSDAFLRDEATRRRSLRAASGASAGSDPEDVIGDMFGGSARAPTAPVELTLGSEQLVRVRPVLRLLSCSTASMRATAGAQCRNHAIVDTIPVLNVGCRF